MRELLASMDSRELAEWQIWYAQGAEESVLDELKSLALARLGQQGKSRRRR